MKKRYAKTLSLVLAVITLFSVMIAVPEEAFAVNVTTESALVSAVGKGGAVKLTKDITISGMLVIPGGKTVTLDLNGKTLKRTGAGFTEEGSVIKVEEDAVLTVNDSTHLDKGTITGGAAIRGGGICNYGKLTVNGGRIMGNRAGYEGNVDPVAVLSEGAPEGGQGGGIYNAEGASLTLCGGSIIRNETKSGGGVYNAFGAELIIQDGSYTKTENGATVSVPTGVAITENSSTGNGCGIYSAGTMSLAGRAELSGNARGMDLYLAYGKKFTCGTLTYTKPFGIVVNGEDAVVTEGFSYNNQGKPEQFFFSSDTNVLLRLSSPENGEIQLYTGKNTIVEVYENGKLSQVIECDTPSTGWDRVKEYSQPNTFEFKDPDMKKKAEALCKKIPAYYSDDFGDWYELLRSDLDTNWFDFPDPYVRTSYDGNDGALADDHQVKMILGTDWTFSERNVIARFSNIIIDLNGHAIKQDRGGNKSGKGYFFFLNDFAKLTIIDSNPNSKGYDGFKGGVITGGSGSSAGGGFIVNDYGELNILGGTIYDCCTDEHGGAIYANDPHAVITLKNCTFDSCRTQDSKDDCNGGALYIRHTRRLTMENVTFSNCSSEDNGGAIYMAHRPGIVSMKNVTFSNNKALDFGGAMVIGSIDDGKHFMLEAEDCVFTNNECGKDGGAVCVSDNDDTLYNYPTLFQSCSFTYNTSGRDGSAFELDDNSVVLLDCTITGNEAKGRGAIYVNDERSVNVGGKTVINNNSGQNVILDKNDDQTRIYPVGLTEGADIVVNSTTSSGSILLMKGVDKRQLKYFTGEGGYPLEFKKTGTKEAALTLASLFSEGSLVLLVCMAMSAGVLAAALAARKKGEEAEEKHEAAE